MPKMKTHKGTKKRVKVTGSGKISIDIQERAISWLKRLIKERNV